MRNLLRQQKIKHNSYIPLIFASLIVFSYTGCTTMKPIDRVQPLSIMVVDAVTKAPLSGIKVYRILETYTLNDTILFLFPNPEPRLKKRIVIADDYVTDANGRVQIDQKPISLHMNEKIYYETIACNLEYRMDELDIRRMKKRHQTKYHIFKHYIDGYIVWSYKFYRPQNNYRGANLLSGIADRRIEGFVRQSYYEDVDFLWNEVDWASELPRDITIELKPYTTEDAAIIEQRRKERDQRIMEEMHKKYGP